MELLAASTAAANWEESSASVLDALPDFDGDMRTLIEGDFIQSAWFAATSLSDKWGRARQISD
jgi:hypothetical protein